MILNIICRNIKKAVFTIVIFKIRNYNLQISAFYRHGIERT